jgi:hypothetical protein
MAVNFPDNPIVNDEFTSGTRTWIWDGNVWLIKSTLDINVNTLNDVTLTNLANGDALLYNSTSQEWENGAVDVQGAIDTANAYTDSAVLDLTEYIDGYLDPSTGTTTDYIDQQDAATLATANAYTDAAIDSVVGLAPETLDTLAELAGAINNDPDFLSNIDALPDQTGQSGNYLTTDGTTASWSAIDIPSTTVSENAPAGAEEGDTWFRSSTGQYFVYYDSYWIEVGAGSDPDLSAYYTSTETDIAISAAINGLIDSAPSTLDTLNELAAALADDADFASTIVNQIGTLESTLQASIDQRKVEINQAVSSDVTLATGYRYFVDTSAARTLTLPLTPTLGDEIQLFDSVGTGSTNNVTINNNSEKINGVLDSAIIDIDGFATVFVYTGSTYGWRMI